MAKVSRKTALIVALMLAVTATVLVIGPAVQAANTDVSISDYSQCTDGTADDDFKACTGWINGILNAQNSTYHEDEVTPQRLLLKVPKGAVLDHSLDLTYLTRKGSAQAHAYDSLATWNFTQTEADRCQSLNNCPTGTDPSVEIGIPTDPTAVPPATTQGGNASTAFRELPQANRQLQFFGPVTSATTPVPIFHSAADSPSSDDYATLTVNYMLDATVVDTDGDGKVDATTYVQLVFGGHLAASGGSRSWGAGLGAANINGGPYHIRVTKIDATAIGNRDNQITSGAILPIQTTVVTELHQTTVAGADLVPPNNGLEISAALPAAGGGTIYVVDYATVNPSGTTGSVDFRYYTSLEACELDTTGTGGTGAGDDKPLNAQGTATSNITSFTSAGTFWWRAFYTGEDINLPSFSACNEKLTITQDTSTSTLLHETNSTGTDVVPANNSKTITVSPGAYVKDEATVSPSTATGSVAFKYYADTIVDGVTKTALANCTDDTNGTSVTTATFSGGTAFSNAVQFTAAGTFYWRAFFTGTAPNNNSSSPCDEILTVQKVSPTLTTAPSLIPQDSATLTGILAGGGPATLTFELFKPLDTCAATDTPVFTQTVNVSGNGTYPTTNSGNPSGPSDNTAFRLTSGSPTGVYKWKVVYSGNDFNNGTTSICGVESFDFQGITDDPPVVP